jgi:hypothetical protein
LIAGTRRRAITAIDGEHLIHKELWRIVERQVEHALNHPTGRAYDNLVAMVFTFLALEAYLNFVGERLDPDFWKNERAHFARTGFEGKLKWVLGKIGLQHRAGARPYTTVQLLAALRDLVVHGKTVRFKKTMRHAVGKTPPLHQMPLWDELITEQRASIAVSDVKSLVEAIHETAKKAPINGNWWGDAPFGGITGHVEGGTRIEEIE